MIGRTNAGGGGKTIFPTGIEITSPPNKTTYNAGENINLTGIAVTATFSDGSTQDITSECTFSPSSGTVVYENTTKITANWTWEDTIAYTTNTAITVKRVLTGLSITTQPAKTSYDKGDTLDLTGMVVTATFSSGASEDVTSGCSFSPAAGSALSSYGTVTVTVTYTENGVTKTASFTVSVSVKTVTWANGTDEEIVAMVEAADQGVINLSDYWAVGDTRTVQLSAMSATGVGESHAAQEVELVLMHAGGYKLADGSICSFVVGQKDCLAEKGYMNSTGTNSGSWDGSARRTWCNSVYKNAIPSSLQPIFKQFKTITAETYNGTTLKTSIDYFALPAAKEIFGGDTASSAGSATSSSNLTEFNALFQFDYYKTTSNRVKKLGKTGKTGEWWERSPHYKFSTNFCIVYVDGSANGYNASVTFGLAPFGCI